MGAKVATPTRVRYPRPLIDRFLCTTCRDVERWTSRVLIVTLVGILIIGHAGDFRKRQGLTQQELTHQVGKTVDTISNIERGFSSTRIETAIAIADALGTTLSDLFDFQAVPPEQREARRLTNELLELIRPLDASTIEAITAQVEILLRVRERVSK